MAVSSQRSVFDAAPKRGLSVGVIGAVALIAALVIGVSALRAASAQDGPGEADATPVETFEARYLPAAEVDERFPGVIAAARESDLGFETGGRIAEIRVDVGDRVIAGDRVAALDTRSLEAQLAATRAQAAEARANAGIAETTRARQQTLLERGHISQQRLDEADAAAVAARARAQAAEASAEAIAVQLDLAVIEAPFDGVVTRRLIDEGAVIAPGAPVLRLVETDRLEVRVGLPADRAARLEPGSLYRFVAGSRRFEARLRAQTGVVEQGGRTVAAVFDIEDTERVAAGEVARLVLPGAVERRGFWAPVSALSEARRGLWSVYVLVEDAGGAFRLEPRTVELLLTEGGRAYVAGAVNDGDRLLASGLQRVSPGVRVRPAMTD